MNTPIGNIFSLNEFAGLIRSSRKRLGLTQAQLAALAETGVRFVNELERGKTTVQLGKTLKVLSVLGVNLRPERVAASPHAQVDAKADGRPRSLRKAWKLGQAHGNTDAFIREFLDEFYSEPDPARREAMLREEPPLSEDDRANAYFGAVAEHLARMNDLTVPEWAGHPQRFLKMPFFPAGLESLKATCLMESPTAFRRRLIFVDANPLYRPRRDKVGIG